MKKLISIIMTASFLLTSFATLSVCAATKYSYNQTKALKYAAEHWDDGKGLCAEFVWRCVQAGGINISKKTGTRSCFNGIVNNSYATKYQLKLNSKGYATKADNSSILAPGDVVVQYCTGCDLFPHIILFSKYDSSGNALYYAHNGAMNNAKYKLNQNSQHTKKTCNIIAYVAHFPQGSVETNDNTAPASVALSKSTLNLDLSSKPTDTVNITLSGQLPSQYTLYFECDTKVNFSWGIWSDNNTKNSITITATEDTKNGANASIILKDSSGKVHASKSFTINVTKPQVSTAVELSKSVLNLDLSSKPTETVDITLLGKLPSQYTLYFECDTNVNFYWGNWSDNDTKNSITITATEDTKNVANATIYLKDTLGMVHASKSFTINVTRPETCDISLSKSTLNLNYSSKSFDTLVITPTSGSSQSFDLSVSLPPEFTFVWSNVTSTSIDLTVFAAQNVDKTGEGTIYIKDKVSGNVLKTKTFKINLVASDIEIIYDANGGKYAPDTEYLKTGSTLYITSEEPIRTGYTFKGWSKSKNDKYPQYTSGDAIHISDSGFTLYAVWSSNTAYEEKFADRDKNGISVYVDGKKVLFDVQPMLINNRTMVPLRAIFEALGVTVDWDDATQTAIGKTQNTTVKFIIGQDFMLKNNEAKYLDSPAVLISDRTLIPVRALAESLDCDVKWHDDIQVVEIVK